MAMLKMLYGPPGTGKTWLAAREAVKAVDPAGHAAALAGPRPALELQRLHRTYVAEGRIVWVTFHPNYSYEDFVEGYRPIVKDGVMTYEPLDGPFKRLCERLRRKVDLEVGDMVPGGGNPYEVMEVDEGGWVLRIRPGRTDEVAEFIDKYVPRRTIEALLARGIPPAAFSVPGGGPFELVRYGLNPGDPDIPAPRPEDDETIDTRKGPQIRKVFAARSGILNSSDFSNNSLYGALLRRLGEIRAAQGPSRPAALVIDEFNRADPSRVFGELLTLLEPDKREGMPEERRVWLPYSRRTLSVPQDLSVIGTMNTVDKSLAPVDFAMRRRFRFQYVGPEPGLLPENYGGVNLRSLLSRVNARLSALLGTGHEIGHALLLPEKLADIGERLGGADDDDRKLRAVAYVVRTSILPTIAEYFHEDWTKVRAVVGETVVANEVVRLHDFPEVDAAFVGRLPDGYELTEGRVAYMAEWWNPEAATWNGDKFGAFLAGVAGGN
jgi:5-methylcytosine-specific restriction protein B